MRHSRNLWESKPVAEQLVDALKRLEYRGYDLAGVATLEHGRSIAVGRKASCAISTRLDREPLPGKIGIGHTRWATHGRPPKTNAHPHVTDLVRSSITASSRIFANSRNGSPRSGAEFSSDTDTEVIAHLVT